MEWMKSAVCKACGSKVEVIDGESLRTARAIAGLSVRAMAKRLGMSASYVSEVERGTRKGSPRVLEEYQKAWREAKA